MLDMHANMCDLRAGHWQREIVCRSHYRGGDRRALLPQGFAQTWHSTGRCICAVVAVLCQARQQAAGSMSGQCPFWDLLLAWKFVLLRVFPEFPCERPLGLLRAGGGFRVGASGPGVDSCDEQDGKRRQRLCMRCILVCRLEYIHDLVAKL